MSGRIEPQIAVLNLNGELGGRTEDTVFRALADPSRRAILERLTHGESAVKDLTARFDIS